MRRQQKYPPMMLLSHVMAEIERLKVGFGHISDGRSLVYGDTGPGGGNGDSGGPAPAAMHVLYGSKHTKSLKVSAGTGLYANYEEGPARIDETYYAISSGQKLCAASDTNYVYVDNSGVVQVNTTGFPANSIPLAEVVCDADSVTVVNDRRSYLQGHDGPSFAGTLKVDVINEYTADAGVTVEGVLFKDSIISWAGDTNLYRGAANVLKTDDALHVAGDAGFGVAPSATYGLSVSKIATTAMTVGALIFYAGQTLDGNDAGALTGVIGAITLIDAGFDKTGMIAAGQSSIIIAGTGTHTLAVGYFAALELLGTPTVTDWRGVSIVNVGLGGGPGVVTTQVGLHVAALSGAGTNIAIQTLGGEHRFVGGVKIGADSAPAQALDVAGNILASGTVKAAAIYPDASDANFHLDLVGVNPRLTVDVGDYLEYVRATNIYDWYIGGAIKMRLTTGQLQLSTIGAAGGLLLGGDVFLYRQAANVLGTPDSIDVVGHSALGPGASISANQTVQIAETYANASGVRWGANIVLTVAPITTSTGDYRALQTYIGAVVDEDLSGYLYGHYMDLRTGVGPPAGKTYSSMYGISMRIGMSGAGAQGTISNMHGIRIAWGHVSGAAGTTTTARAIQIGALEKSGGTINDGRALHIGNVGAAITSYGILIDDQTGAGTHYGIAIAGADTQVLWLASASQPTDAANGIAFGSARDTNLYRSAANILKTDDKLMVHSALGVGGYADLSSNNRLMDIDGLLSTAVAYGMVFTPRADATVTTFYGIYARLVVNAGTVTDGYDLYLDNPDGAGAITNAYGLYINDITKGAGANYGIYFAGVSGLARQGIWWNGDTNLYRSAANILKTDDAFHAAAGLKADSLLELTPTAGVTIEGTKLIDSYLLLAEIAKPANPADGFGKLYMKNDDIPYWLDKDGVEHSLIGGVGDAADLTYTPAVAADWDSGADPGDQDEANDQLAERVTDLEERGVYEYGSSTVTVIGTSGQWQASTPFVGSCNGAPPSKVSIPYNVTSGELSICRGQVIHNTTKGEKCYIEAVNWGTNTLTIEADSPDDCSTWDNLDVLTTASQVNLGRTGTFVDIDVTPHIIAGSHPVACVIQGYTAMRNADTWFLLFHPYEAYDMDKELNVAKQWQTDTMYYQPIVPLTEDGGRFYFTLNFFALVADNASSLFRWGGQFSSLVA